MTQDLIDHAGKILAENDKGGYTVPTHGLYPFQWNWDSCLTALGQAYFDEDRAWTEIETLFAHQWDDGMVPHIIFHELDDGYFPGPDVWNTGRKVPTSGITQPAVAGFAVARLLTHWAEIAGEDLARVTRPVKVGYGREGMGASLTLLTTGAMAPMVEMQKDRLRERVNAAYGYAAISRILLTQTAATGFAEGQVEFAPAPKTPPKPDPAILAKAAETAAPVKDPDLRAALEAMAQNILTRRNPKEGQ